jgi:imidazolonepropionase-like amidohydrolase/ABC-type multidrug transport system permease subunit
MKAYLVLVRVNLRLALRERVAIFFNYIFPLVFFFAFGSLMHAERGGVTTQVVTMVLVIGILGNGLFGGGIRTVQDREQNILRRYKVAPISPTPLLVASVVTGWVLYLPAVVTTFVLARIVYGLPFPARWLSLLVLVSAGVIAFRAVGLIIASVANSAQESQILVQLVYLPMLFLSGTTVPLTFLPTWTQSLAHFLPATYLVTALQGVLVRGETLVENGHALSVLLLTTLFSGLFASVLFRWEKEEKLRPSAKLALVAVVLPSLVFGVWQTRTHGETGKAKALYREMQRGRTLLVHNARIFVGDGRVISSGAVLVRAGKIAEVYEGSAPGDVRADVLEAAGKTLLPGLIDASVRLTAPGGFYQPATAYEPVAAAGRALAAYLYCGVTGVRSDGDPPAVRKEFERAVASGELLGAEVFDAVEPETLPLLGAIEAATALRNGDTAPLERGPVLQVAPPRLLASTRAIVEKMRRRPAAAGSDELREAGERLLRAYRAGTPLVAGGGGGVPLVVHGPGLSRELELWVQAGIPPRVALAAATGNAARLVGAGNRVGSIRTGYDANLVIVDGNPLEDIAALERITAVIFKGERIDRTALFEPR